MSNEEKEKYISHVINGVGSMIISIIVLFVGQHLSGKESERQELKTALENKADKVYVDKAIKDNNAVTITAIEYLIKTVDKIDKRTERLEDIQMSKK